jgi:pteridine reductase
MKPLATPVAMPSPAEPISLPEYPEGPRGTALVTGASRRVGRAIAVELARQGLGLALTFRTRQDECMETARLATDAAAAAGHAISTACLRLDLADVGATERFAREVERARAACGATLDAIVHNASAYEETPLDGIDPAIVEEFHRIEVVSPLVLTERLRGALASSKLEGGGAVVLFSDIHVIGRARPGFAAYGLAKCAVEGLARQLAVELAPRTRVHCVAPGVVMWPDHFPEETKAQILSRTPLGRAGTPEEAAKLVRFLILEATYSTGDTVRIDGGRSLR